MLPTLFLGLLPLISSSIVRVTDTSWELIGSRTYEWKGDEVLRCRHWDKVALRWHMYLCSLHNSSSCEGGSNVDYAIPPEDMKSGEWHNAFTYVQYDTKDTKQRLSISLTSYEEGLEVPSIVPLKIDVDWKWTKDEYDCNRFTLRMSAMSSLERIKHSDVAQFCRSFDKDAFVNCDSL